MVRADFDSHIYLREHYPKEHFKPLLPVFACNSLTEGWMKSHAYTSSCDTHLLNKFFKTL